MPLVAGEAGEGTGCRERGGRIQGAEGEEMDRCVCVGGGGGGGGRRREKNVI